MAFVNVETTEEERELFKQRNIIDPYFICGEENRILWRKEWTIDRDREAFIFEVGYHRDWPDEKIFFYQLRDIHMMISIKYRWDEENTIIYSLDNKNSLYTPLNDIKDKKHLRELKGVLAQALKQYKYDGGNDEENMAINVICEF